MEAMGAARAHWLGGWVQRLPHGDARWSYRYDFLFFKFLNFKFSLAAEINFAEIIYYFKLVLSIFKVCIFSIRKNINLSSYFNFTGKTVDPELDDLLNDVPETIISNNNAENRPKVRNEILLKQNSKQLQNLLNCYKFFIF